MSFGTFVADRGPPYRICDIFDEVGSVYDLADGRDIFVVSVSLSHLVLLLDVISHKGHSYFDTGAYCMKYVKIFLALNLAIENKERSTEMSQTLLLYN